MKYLILPFLFAVPAFAKITTLEVAEGQRWIQGFQNDQVTNMFLASVVKQDATSKLACGVNVNAETSLVSDSYVRGHDVQYFFMNKAAQSFTKIGFNSKLTPFTYENCVTTERGSSPEDDVCVKTETVRGVRNAFTFAFESAGAVATIECEVGQNLNGEKVALTERQAEALVRRYLILNFN